MVNDGLFPSLKLGTIHIWLAEIGDQTHDVLSLEKLLSPEEIERSKHYRFELDRFRFVIRRGILRELLGRYIGVVPGDIKYLSNSYGKLSFPSHPLQFSVSHSHNRIAYAFTLEQDIGVDIEQVKQLPDLAQMVKTWFSLEECNGIFSLDPSDQLESFYHVWTQKEAFIKVSGEGLSFPLGDFSVSVDPHNPGRLLSKKKDDPSQWQMVCMPEPGWRVAVCIHSKSAPKVEHNNISLQDFFNHYIDSTF